MDQEDIEEKLALQGCQDLKGYQEKLALQGCQDLKDYQEKLALQGCQDLKGYQEKLALQDQEPKYLKCSKCHNGEPNVTGPDGNSHPVNQCRSIIPNLHGQPEDYLKRELYKFQVGQRKNGVMNSITRNLEHGDIETLAQWGAIKSSSIRDCNMPDLPKCNDLNFLETKKIVDECGAECHGRDFKNGLKKGCRNSENGPYCYPRIFGQKAQYLYKQLDDFRTGKRKSDVMNAMAKRIRDHSMLGKENYDPNMLSCIAEYLCTQNPN